MIAWRSETVITFQRTAKNIEIANIAHTSGHCDEMPITIDVIEPKTRVAQSDGPARGPPTARKEKRGVAAAYR